MARTPAAKRSQAALSIPDAAWAEAVRREAVVRPLAAEPRLGRAAIAGAACRLGLCAAQVYSLVRVLRAHPVTASLAPFRPGPAKDMRLVVPTSRCRTGVPPGIAGPAHWFSRSRADGRPDAGARPSYGEPGHFYGEPGVFL